MDEKSIEERLKQLPQGTLTFKTIKGREQPYLQWTEDGKSKCVYIKVNEREELLELIEERRHLQNQLKRIKKYGEKCAKILQENPFLNQDGGIGYQHFENFMEKKMFYVDKTKFIYEWWNRNEAVTLLTRPRRFGKTLLLSTVDNFFSVRYTGRKEWFEQLAVGKNHQMMQLLGTKPVIFMTFAGIKEGNYDNAVRGISGYMAEVFDSYRCLLDSTVLSDEEKEVYSRYRRILFDSANSVSEQEACCMDGLRVLSELLCKHYDSKVIILIDEYDTPLIEAHSYGYWDQMAKLMRVIFNSSLKTNIYLERALLTGITRVMKESLFSDLNNLEVASVTTSLYEDCCGFTEKEVMDILAVRNRDELNEIKAFYDGFTFGKMKNIYNPWSIVNYIDLREFRLYWGNSGGYGLLSDVILNNRENILPDLQELLYNRSIHKVFDESFSMYELNTKPGAIWALLLATGYIKADNLIVKGRIECDLSITNIEAQIIMDDMVKSWFQGTMSDYTSFLKWLEKDDIEGMNHYMNNVVFDMVSVFDVGTGKSKQPEKFYHGLILGLLVELRSQYEVLSNRESGFGRFDIMLKPLNENLDGIIFEFKVCDKNDDETMKETAQKACQQIVELDYERELLSTGLPREKIRKYGFAFCGKKVLIMRAAE